MEENINPIKIYSIIVLLIIHHSVGTYGLRAIYKLVLTMVSLSVDFVWGAEPSL